MTIELRKLGHEAYSCDVEPCSGGFPEWHLQQDVIPLLQEKWDMILAFPPCTYLSKAGARHLYPKRQLDRERYERGVRAKDFFMKIYNADCPKIAIENPVSLRIYELPECSQTIRPWQFGHPYTKTTRLWLKGLPQLMPTSVVPPKMPYVNSSKATLKGQYGSRRTAKNRAKTFPGIAKAMAEQWAGERTEQDG